MSAPAFAGRGLDSDVPGLERTRQVVRDRLGQAAEVLTGMGLPVPALDGKSLRPLTAFLTVPEDRRGELDERFWMGALAVEMTHEASLLHDDILDEAPERRGRPTVAAAAGVGPALVLGDHLLTSAYRAALLTRSPSFLDLFITSVERTVAGEIAQEKSQGRILSLEEYRTIVTGKSGELFRSVFALAPDLLAMGSRERVGALGARLGCLYQMVDDFLDYCPEADRGKIPLQDYRQEKWTWPLGLIGAEDFAAGEEEVLDRLFRPSPLGGPAPMEEGARTLAEETRTLLRDLAEEGMEAQQLSALLQGWIGQVREATRLQVSRRSARGSSRLTEEEIAQTSWPTRAPSPAPAPSPNPREELAAALSTLEGSREWLAYFGKHAKSFRFASRLFPPQALHQVAGVYAFCRFTDDLVDEARGADPEHLQLRLTAWLDLARDAHQGTVTGIPLLDEVVGSSGRAGVPFHYMHELVEGVRMDLSPRLYGSLEELRRYSYRVASVVGGWLTELFGVHDPWVLDRAFALGHAMQLTNILRDVGEDLRNGRVYLPQDRMAQFGVDRDLLDALALRGRTIPPGYRGLLEELMLEADADYERAFQAIPALPPFFQRPVAVAARVYQGIHDEIRRNRYDNLTRRASTSPLRKVWLGGSALLSLRRLPDPLVAESRGSEPASPALNPENGQEVPA